MKKIILVLSVLFSTHIMAYQVKTGKIRTINVNPHSVLVTFFTSNTNDDNCTHSASSHTLILPLTDDTKAMYTALLSASINEKTSRVLYEKCLLGFPLIIRADIVND